MSTYDITEFLRTAYRPFAYCVPSKFPLNTAYQRGVSPFQVGRHKLLVQVCLNCDFSQTHTFVLICVIFVFRLSAIHTSHIPCSLLVMSFDNKFQSLLNKLVISSQNIMYLASLNVLIKIGWHLEAWIVFVYI